MDLKPTKIPRMENYEDVHSENRMGITGNSAVEQNGAKKEEINYFTQKCLHVWPDVLDYLTDVDDIMSVLSASPLFAAAWGSRRVSALFPFVIPLLVKTNYIKSKDVLPFRHLNKVTKLVIDDFLTKTQPSWLLTPFSFQDYDEIQTFMEHFHGATASPFISKYCNIQADNTECFDRAVDMLTEFGDSLHKFEFEMSFNENRPSPLMDGLVEVLELVPNIDYLLLKFPGYDAEFEDDWENFRRRLGTSFPELNAITELNLQLSEITESENHPPGSFIKPILKAYGNQLTTFKCDGFLLQDFDSQFCSQTLTKLNCFWIFENYPEVDNYILSHEMLSHVEWPKLENLALLGHTCHTKETFEALNNFRINLKELRLDSLENQSFDLNDIDPLYVLPFPNLKSLTVGMDDATSSMWHFFRNQFTNLEILRFESNDESFDEQIPSVPQMQVRKRFFAIFPKLCKLIWKDGGNESVYLRDSSLYSV